MKQEYSAGAVVYCQGNEIEFLLLQNTLKKTYWEFPKGKIEDKEDIQATVKREIEEETGLKNFKIIPDFKEKITWFFKFKGDLIKKESTYLLAEVKAEDKNQVRISNEHQEFKWMTFSQANKEINIKANKVLVNQAYNFINEKNKQRTLV